MGWHQIQVDDEVMGYLKAKGEPFVDTPNSVLRRELLRRVTSPGRPGLKSVTNAGGPEILPSLPLDFPEALRQILEVVYLVLRSSRTRGEATHLVARHHTVAPQTVLDKYTRQLGISASQFDGLLSDRSLSELVRKLVSKFPHKAKGIRELLEGWIHPNT